MERMARRLGASYKRGHFWGPTLNSRNAWLFAALFLLASCSTCGETSLEKTVPLLTPSSSDVEFGDVVVGARRVREVRLQSTGTGTLHLESVTLEGDAAFSFQEPVGATALTPNASLPVHVVLLPTAAGPVTGTLVVTGDAENAPTLRIPLTGNGTAPPSCDDLNTCTNDAFDAVLGVCVHVNNLDPCSSGSQCTHDDRCVDGQCRGLATTCEDSNACTRNLCDTTFGCVFVPVSCEDGNTCTLDTCDPVQGCAHHALPDGALCEDGNLCSLGDQCASGVCRGAPSQEDPAQVGVAYAYGRGGQTIPLKDGRILFLDLVIHGPGDLFTRATVVDVTNDRLVAVKTSDLPGMQVGSAPELMENGAVAVLATVDGVNRIHLLTVGMDGSVRDAGSTAPVTEAARQLTHLGNVFYMLGSTIMDPALVVVDASDPVHPLLSSAVLTGEFLDVAVDAPHALLLASGRLGLTRFSLSNPLQPVMQDLQVAAPGIYLAVSDGVLTVTVSQEGGAFDVRSADTGMLLRSIPFALPLGANVPYSMVLSGNRLWAATQNAVLSAYDVGAAGSSTPLATVSETVHGFGALHLGGVGQTLVTAGSAVFSTSDAPGLLKFVSGPGHGTMGVLHNNDGQLVTASWDSAHRLDLTNAAVPRFAEGSSFSRSAKLVSFSSLLRTPTLLVEENSSGSRDPAVMDAVVDYGHGWVDAFDLDHPQVMGTVRFPFLGGIHSYLRSDGRRIYMMQGNTTANGLTVDVINADNAMGVGDLQIPSNAPTTFMETLTMSYGIPGYLAKDPDARHIAVSTQERSSSLHRSHVLVVDTSDTQALTQLATFNVDYRVAGLAMVGQLIATLDEGAFATTADNVHFYTWDANQQAAPHEVGSFRVEGVQYFLLMDSHVLLMATATGVAYANVFANPPSFMGEVPTPETRPTSALIHQDKLILAFPGEVVVLSPPCPVVP